MVAPLGAELPPSPPAVQNCQNRRIYSCILPLDLFYIVGKHSQSLLFTELLSVMQVTDTQIMHLE